MIITCAGTYEEITGVQKEIQEEGLETLQLQVVKVEDKEVWMVTFEYEGKVI